jgi:hypothetical protein
VEFDDDSCIPSKKTINGFDCSNSAWISRNLGDNSSHCVTIPGDLSRESLTLLDEEAEQSGAI